VRSAFKPTFSFNSGFEGYARARFSGGRFGSFSQSLFSQLPVRLISINQAQGKQKGGRRVSIGNTLAAEVSLDFIVPKGHSAIVQRLPSFVECQSGRLVLRQNINLSKLLLDRLNPPCAERVCGSLSRAHQSRPSDVGHRHDSDRQPVGRAIVECLQLFVKNPDQLGARNLGFSHTSPCASGDHRAKSSIAAIPSFVGRATN
jgi:hypothetical protein